MSILSKDYPSKCYCCTSEVEGIDLNPDVIGQEKIPDVYGPFVSHGTISLVGSVEERPVTILRDTGHPSLSY